MNHLPVLLVALFGCGPDCPCWGATKIPGRLVCCRSCRLRPYPGGGVGLAVGRDGTYSDFPAATRLRWALKSPLIG